MKLFKSLIPFIFFLFPMGSLFSISVTNTQTDLETKGEFKPWFTGPILAGSGKTAQKGHIAVQPYIFVFDINGFYNNSWKQTKIQKTIAVSHLLIFVTGLNSFMDILFKGGYDSNFSQKQKDTRFNDCSLVLGFQALNDKRNSWEPDLRIILNQDFPTGHYQHLNPKKNGTDGSGLGFYRTGIAFNFQKMFFFKKRLFRTRCNFNYKISPKTKIKGFNVFGGGYGTNGKISSIHFFTGDLAFEYTLTQNLTLAFDLYYELWSKGTFSGKPGVLKDNSPANNSSPFLQRLSLAPALEYNFSANSGLIIGSWFSLCGKNAGSFCSGVVAFNYYH